MPGSESGDSESAAEAFSDASAGEPRRTLPKADQGGTVQAILSSLSGIQALRLPSTSVSLNAAERESNAGLKRRTKSQTIVSRMAGASRSATARAGSTMVSIMIPSRVGGQVTDLHAL